MHLVNDVKIIIEAPERIPVITPTSFLIPLLCQFFLRIKFANKGAPQSARIKFNMIYTPYLSKTHHHHFLDFSPVPKRLNMVSSISKLCSFL